MVITVRDDGGVFMESQLEDPAIDGGQQEEVRDDVSERSRGDPSRSLAALASPYREAKLEAELGRVRERGAVCGGG